jgi:hypothetical protein
MSVGRARRRIVKLLELLTALGAALAVLVDTRPAGAAEPGPPITEIVPVRIHGHDSSWPPILVFGVFVVVVGGIVVCLVFMRRAREALHARPLPPST